MADTTQVAELDAKSAQVVLEAVDTLSSIELPEPDIPENNVDILERVHSTGCRIVTFLENFNPTRVVDLASISLALAALLNVPFIHRLFEFRRLFYSVAARFDCPGETRVVVCWVDHLFSRLGNIGLAVLHSNNISVEVTGNKLLTISKHRDQAALEGATQLPHSLTDVVDVISSEYTSPAAVRLTLRLLYAVYIVGPDLGNVDLWTSDEPKPTVLLRSLHTYILKPDKFTDRENKLANAMAVALFAAVDGARSRQECSPFRPHTQATLLEMISATLPLPYEPFAVLTPVMQPPACLAALFATGSTVQWCWTIWNDERVVGHDTVLAITSTWLYHLGREDHYGLCQIPRDWRSVLLAAISKDPPAAAIAISALLHRMKQSLSSSQRNTPLEILDVVMKCCQGASWLLIASYGAQRPPDFILGLSNSLYGLFILLPDEPLASDVKDVIIEGISYVPHGILVDTVKELNNESGINIASRLDDKIHVIRRLDKNVHWPACHHRAATQLLQFITIIAHADVPVKRCFYSRSISAFFKHILDWLGCPAIDLTQERSKVLQCFLTTLAVLETSGDWDHIVKLWANEEIWDLAMDSDNQDTTVDAAFATYILATAKHDNVDSDSLRQATAWVYLYDTLRGVLSDRDDTPGQPIQMYVCAVTLAAMQSAVDHANKGALDHVRSSPWSMSLYQDLQKLERDGGSDVWLQTIRPLAASLLSKLDEILSKEPEASGQEPKESHTDEIERRLLCFATDLPNGPYLCLLNVGI